MLYLHTYMLFFFLLLKKKKEKKRCKMCNISYPTLELCFDWLLCALKKKNVLVALLFPTECKFGIFDFFLLYVK